MYSFGNPLYNQWKAFGSPDSFLLEDNSHLKGRNYKGPGFTSRDYPDSMAIVDNFFKPYFTSTKN